MHSRVVHCWETALTPWPPSHRPAPWDAEGIDPMAGRSPGNAEEFGAALQGREALEELLAGQAAAIAADPWALITGRDDQLPEDDIASLHNEERFKIFAETLQEAVAQGPAGWADEPISRSCSRGASISAPSPFPSASGRASTTH